MNLRSQSSNIVDLASFPLFIYLFDDTLKILECKKKKVNKEKEKKSCRMQNIRCLAKNRKGDISLLINGILSK